MTDPSPSPIRRVSPLVWILMVALLLRALVLIGFRHQPLAVWDEREYNELAVNLATQGQYVLNGQPCSMRPPLYPAVVAGVYKLFGVENHQAVRLFQILTELMTVAVLYLLGTEVYGRRIGLVAAGLYAVYPSAIAQAGLVLSETLFTFWLVLACLMVVRALSRDAIGYLALAGAVIGLAALTRSVFWLLPPVLAVYLLAVWKTTWRRRLAGVTLMLVAFAASIAPWSIRCTRLERTFVAVDVMGGRNFMMGNYEHTPLDRAWDAISVEGDEAWYRVLGRAHPEFGSLTQGQRDKLALRYGLRFVADHPWLTLKRDVVKFFNFWQLERAMIAGMAQGLWGNLSGATIAAAAALILGAYVATMTSGIFGATMAPPENWRIHGLLLLVLALVCGVHTLVFAHSRYHLSLMPLVLLYSAAGLVDWRRLWQRRRTWPFWLAVGLCVLLVAGWTGELLLADYDRIVGLLKRIVTVQ